MNKVRNKQGGFSLIELMIVVVLAGILLAIAIPAYGQYMEKSRRSDARAALLEIASVQERIFFERNQYSAAIADVWTNVNGSGDPASSEGFYLMTVVTANGGAEFTATATATRQQAGDEDCQTLTIDETGLRDATAGAGGDDSVCW